MSFTATASTTSGGNWLTVCLSVTCGSGATFLTTDTNNGHLTIQADPTSLEAGTYRGTIVLACSPATACASISISVIFQVNGIIVTVAPNQIAFTVAQGQSATGSVSLSGAGNVSITVTSGGDWLSAPPTLSTPGTLMLTASAAALSSGGPYAGSVLIQCVSGPPCLSKTVSASLTVSPPSLNPSVTAVSLPGVGGGPPVSTMVTITSMESGLAFTATASTNTGGACLSVSPTPTMISGPLSTPRVITIQANPVNLAAGTYTGYVSLACTAPGSSYPLRHVPAPL